MLYLHRVTDVRALNQSLLNIEVLKALCGREFYPHVGVCSTMWDVAALGPEALSHNRARVSGFIAAGTVFGELLNSGAIHQELWADNQDSDRKILAFFENSPHPMLTIQRELHSQKP